MESRIEFRPMNISDAFYVVINGVRSGVLATNSEDEWYAEIGPTIYIDKDADEAAARRAVESAFEAWMEKAGLVWKDSVTEEKEA